MENNNENEKMVTSENITDKEVIKPLVDVETEAAKAAEEEKPGFFKRVCGYPRFLCAYHVFLRLGNFRDRKGGKRKTCARGVFPCGRIRNTFRSDIFFI